MASWSIGIDIGGTFTDVVAIAQAPGSQHSAKVLTTHDDPTLGVVNAIESLIQATGLHPAEVRRVVHATTLFTNALIERRGAATALLTNRGFEDVLAVGNERKYDLYDLSIERAPALVPSRWRMGVAGRLDAQGNEIEALDPAQALKVVSELREQGVESLAICMLHAWASARHERALARHIGHEFPDLPITLSCDIAPVIREYERVSTTVASAYVKPLATHYLGTLESRLAALGLDARVLMMLSNGGLTHLREARARPIELLESGPAAGAIAAASLGARDHLAQLLAFDMGGTTAKLSLIEGGQPAIAYGFEAARRKRFAEGSGLPIRITTVDLIEIAPSSPSPRSAANLACRPLPRPGASTTSSPKIWRALRVSTSPSAAVIRLSTYWSAPAAAAPCTVIGSRKRLVFESWCAHPMPASPPHSVCWLPPPVSTAPEPSACDPIPTH